MLSSLSSMLFGNGEQDGADCAETNNGTAVSGSQVSQDKNLQFSVAEEDMGWLLVNVSESTGPSLSGIQEEDRLSQNTSPSLPVAQEEETLIEGSSLSWPPVLEDTLEGSSSSLPLVEEKSLSLDTRHQSSLSAQEEDIFLRRPDGSIFCGLLDLSSASSSDSEDGEAARDNLDSVLYLGLPGISRSGNNEAEENLSSSYSSLSVIFESNEEDPDAEWRTVPWSYPHTPEPRLPSDKMTDSWMITPPPRFTGTDINSQMKSSPLENKLIEFASFFACQSIREHEQTLSAQIRMVYEARLRAIERECQRREEQEQPPQGMSGNSRLDVGQAYAPAARSHTSPMQCRGATFLKTQASIQQRHQKAAAHKHLSRNSMERSNKARMAQTWGRKQVSARNRLLRPSGGKCSRYGQRTQ